MKASNTWGIALLLSLALQATNLSAASEAFTNYWRQGKAEITTYQLEQVRYGSVHQGTATFIFVTEPFLATKQVKHEFGDGKDAVEVLKLNATRDFLTGLYPYTILTSVFTPIIAKHPLKVTTSVQEWCGHTFTQLNKRDRHYQMQLRSYFQSEGDQDTKLPATWTEDGLWTLLRLNPDALPKGKIKIIPGTVWQRFSHQTLKPESAVVDLTRQDANSILTVNYESIGRALRITFENQFPHRIQSWSESQPGADLTTTATFLAREQLPYWSLNQPKDRSLRKKLKLDP